MWHVYLFPYLGVGWVGVGGLVRVGRASGRGRQPRSPAPVDRARGCREVLASDKRGGAVVAYPHTSVLRPIAHRQLSHCIIMLLTPCVHATANATCHPRPPPAMFYRYLATAPTDYISIFIFYIIQTNNNIIYSFCYLCFSSYYK